MIVYRAINTVNGKSYIGLSRQPIERRRIQHYSKARTGTLLAFHSAIRKYGEAALARRMGAIP